MLRTPLLTLMVLICLSENAIGQWIQIPQPEGGTVVSMMEAKGVLFAGTATGGIYRFVAREDRWVAVNAGWPLNEAVGTLATNGRRMFAATAQGVYRSNLQGIQWTALDGPFRPNHHPSSSQPSVTALLVDGPTILVGARPGLYRSPDEGQTWTTVDVERRGINALMKWRALLFAASFGRIFRSTDQGSTWTSITTGLPDNQELLGFTARGETLFANSNASGLYQSTDDGLTWRPLSPANMPFAGVAAVAVTPTAILAGAYGLWRSSDGGLTWQASQTGLPDPVFLHTLLVTDGVIFAGTADHGIFRSLDDGQTWTPVNTGLVATAPHLLLQHHGTLFTGFSGQGFFATADGGQTWIDVTPPLPGSTRRFPGIRFLAATSTQTTLFVSMDSGIFRSRDQGVTWTKLNGSYPGNLISALAVQGESVLAGTFGLGLYRTTDEGDSWTPLTQGLPINTIGYTMAVRGDTLFAGIGISPQLGFPYGDGVYRSTDGGDSWMPVNTGFPPHTVVSALVIVGETVLAGTPGQGIYRTQNDGARWEAVNTGLPESVQITPMIVVSDTLVVVGTQTHGIYLTRNRGETWVPITANLPRQAPVSALLVAEGSLYASLVGAGIWQRPLERLTVTDTEQAARTISLRQNSPNPFHVLTTIAYSIPSDQFVTFRIHDLLGREVVTLVRKDQAAGGYTVIFDASGLPSGMYFYTLHTDIGTQTRKMLLLK